MPVIAFRQKTFPQLLLKNQKNKAIRYRVYPNAEQEILLRKSFGCRRFLYNQLLEKAKRDHEDGKK
ncbi:MAG: helix-turn-helix domain-containing protein, partial [Erysipelotrichaceae bacterium]|nr:helix-turn-helix domain-containing protein [Erysipelotrichaceae bacterium]